MYFGKLTVENFLGIGKAELQLGQRGLVLIQGNNRDDSSANSNGAGKSSIPDALCWCLTGQTAREMSGDEVVNAAVGKGTCVSVELTDDSGTYRISRYRKHKTEKNRVRVEQVTPTLQDLTCGTDKLTQSVIDRLLGCDYSVFLSAVYGSQENFPDLPSKTDKELKTLIEHAAGITRLQDAHTIAVEMENAELPKLHAKKAVLESLYNNLQSNQTMLDNLKDSETVWSRTRQSRLDDIAQRMADLTTRQARLQWELQGLPSAESLLRELQRAADSAMPDNSEYERLRTAKQEADLECTALRTQATMMGAEAQRTKAHLDGLHSKIGEPCRECGKPYTEADLEHARDAASISLTEQVRALRRVKSALEGALERATSHSKAMAELSNGMVAGEGASFENSAQDGHRKSLTTVLEKVQSFAAELGRVNTELAHHTTAHAQLTAEHSPYTDLIDSHNQKIIDIHSMIGSATAAVKEHESKLETLSAVRDIFGVAGIRAHVLDTVTPFLNARTAQYLGSLSDGDLIAIWSTISYTAKGDMREKFKITAESRGGAKDFRALSGGQKRKVRLATALALQDLMATRAAKPIEIFIGDEIDDALDVAGLERLMSILEDKAREKGTVLIISHNDLSLWCRQVVTVIREGGVSTLVE